MLRPQLGARDTFGNGFTPAVGFQIQAAKISDDRYLAQLQSLFIGDFLVNPPSAPPLASWPPDLVAAFNAIQDCFVPPPFRYRLTREQALANYTKAEALSRRQSPRIPGRGAVADTRLPDHRAAGHVKQTSVIYD